MFVSSAYGTPGLAALVPSPDKLMNEPWLHRFAFVAGPVTLARADLLYSCLEAVHRHLYIEFLSVHLMAVSPKFLS